jgi:hypothetical protein
MSSTIGGGGSYYTSQAFIAKNPKKPPKDPKPPKEKPDKKPKDNDGVNS